MENNGNTVESCVIYQSYMMAIAELDNDSEKWQIMECIINYALYRKMPNLADLSREQRMIFMMARPTIDSNRANRINGARGGHQRASNRKNTNGANMGNPGANPGTSYTPLYVPPDELRRLQMAQSINELRHE